MVLKLGVNFFPVGALEEKRVRFVDDLSPPALWSNKSTFSASRHIHRMYAVKITPVGGEQACMASMSTKYSHILSDRRGSYRRHEVVQFQVRRNHSIETHKVDPRMKPCPPMTRHEYDAPSR